MSEPKEKAMTLRELVVHTGYKRCEIKRIAPMGTSPWVEGRCYPSEFEAKRRNIQDREAA